MDHENLPAAVDTAGLPAAPGAVAEGAEPPPPPAPVVSPAPEPPAVYEPAFALELDRKAFAAKLRLLFRTAERRNTLPILSHILVKSEGGEAIAVATDLDNSMFVPLGAQLPKDVAFTLPPQVLPLVMKATGDTIPVVLFERRTRQKVPATAGGKRIENVERQVQVGPVRFASLDPREFPPCPGEKLIHERPHASAAFTSFKQVLPAVSVDETRFNLSGVYFRLCKYEMVATDGHRLHLVRIAKELSGTGDFLVEPKALRLLEAAAPKGGEITIGFHKSKAVCIGRAGEYTIASAYIDGVFPDYGQVIPSAGQPNAIRVSRAAFIQALAQAMAILNERARGVKLEISEGKLALRAVNPDAGVFEMDLPSISMRGGGSSLGFNARYLIQILEAVTSEDVTLEWEDDASPLRLEDGDFLGIIMPMRL